MADSDRGGRFVPGLLIGVAAGAAVVLFSAPKRRQQALDVLRGSGLLTDDRSAGTLQGPRARIEAAAAEARRAAARTRQELAQRYQAAKRGDADSGSLA